MKLVKKIMQASFHRNGICGVGFWAILFESTERQDIMVASLFDEEGYCAVYSVNQLVAGNIGFAQGNSWRGDRYEAELRPMLDKWQQEHGSNRIGPFSIVPPEAIAEMIRQHEGTP